MARFVIADDNAAFRALAARVLAADGHHVAGEAATAREAVHLTHTLTPDAILLDVHFGTADGRALARTLVRTYPRVRVFLTSSDPDAGAGVLDKAALATDGLGPVLLD
jgi:DNA-binding NarL/FixJ family response regulator